jgi:DNA-binding GntR family transcriptional regulator
MTVTDSPPPTLLLARDTGSQVQQAYLRIEELIVTLQLAPGQTVSEKSLSQALHLGRTPVREALQQLAREGLVVILPQRGILVSEIDVARQLRMLEFRRSVEQFMVAAAARRATAEERARFATLARRFAAAVADDSGREFLALDVEFSQELANCARNEFATGAMKLVHGLSRRFGYAFDRKWASLPHMAQLHAAVAAAIADGDVDAAVARLDTLIDTVEAFTRRTLDLP